MAQRFLLILFLFFTATLAAQPTIEWQKAYGGSNSEILYDIRQTTDGGYIMIGTTTSSDGDVTGNSSYLNHDMWVVKLDNTGQISWQKTYGGSGMDRGGSIEQTSDGGYIFLTTTNSNDGDVSGHHGSGDAWVVKLTAEGNISWQRTYGGSGGEIGYCIRKTRDGGYIIACLTGSTDGDALNSGLHSIAADVWIVKLTATGTISWQKAYGGVSGEGAFDASIEQTADGGYIVGTNSMSEEGDLTANYGSHDYWVFKLGADGFLEWQKNYGGSKQDECANVLQCADGGYIMTGTVWSWDKDIMGAHSLITTDIWTAKIDDTGKIEWKKALGGKESETGHWVGQDSEGNYITAGETSSTDGDVSGLHGTKPDMWLLSQHPDGSIKWKMTIGGTNTDYAKKIRQSSDGGYIVGGVTNSLDGDATGNGLHSPDTADFWVIKLSSTTDIPKLPLEKNISIYPTVSSEKVFVNLPAGYENAELKVLNLMGQQQDVNKEGNALDRIINLHHMHAGMYLLQVIHKGVVVHTQKIFYRE